MIQTAVVARHFRKKRQRAANSDLHKHGSVRRGFCRVRRMMTCIFCIMQAYVGDIPLGSEACKRALKNWLAYILDSWLSKEWNPSDVPQSEYVFAVLLQFHRIPCRT